jgi:hypothetical protein
MIEVKCIKLSFYKEFIIVNVMPLSFRMLSHV